MTTICVLSDTHDNHDAVVKARDRLNEIAPNAVLHCGDVQSPETVKLFAGLPMHFVFGNCDSQTHEMNAAAKSCGFPPIAEELELSLGGKKLYATHGHIPNLLNEMAYSEAYDFVFHGHTHQYRDETIGATRIVNPGALYRAPEYSFIVLELESGAATREFIEPSLLTQGQ